MSRPVRMSVAGGCYHVINRGNGRAEVFHKQEDCGAFLRLIGEACQRLPMRVLAYCLMPNHLHLALQMLGDGDLSRWMPWLTTSHVRRYLSNGPMDRPADRARRVNRPETNTELQAIRFPVNRGTPFGARPWQNHTATRLGLQSTLRPRGRPRKAKTK